MSKAEPKQQELLKAVADVLDEAMAEYEKLCKMDMEVLQDPSKPSEDKKEEAPVEKAAAEAKPEEDKKDEDKEDEESDEKLMETYKSITAKVEARGLLKKSEPEAQPAKTDEKAPEVSKTEEVAKSEAAPATTPEVKVEEPKAETTTTEEVKKSEPEATKAEDKKEIEDFKKSIDDKLEDFGKKIAEIAETVAKIATTPVPRKGVSGLAPLRKSEEKSGLKKAEVIDKLLDLKKSKPAMVDTNLITRVETGRLLPGDEERINGLLE